MMLGFTGAWPEGIGLIRKKERKKEQLTVSCSLGLFALVLEMERWHVFNSFKYRN